MRERLTYANVMSTLAVVLVICGGTAFAAVHLGKNAVQSRNIAPGAVKAKDIAKGAVKRSKIASSAVDSSKLADGSVVRGKIAAEAVSTGQLAPDAVQETKLAPALRGKVNAVQAGGIVRVDADNAVQITAREHNLIVRGPFRIYAKCWVQGGTVQGQTYISSSQTGTLASGSITPFRGGLNPYLNALSDESGRRFGAATAGPTSTGTLTGASTMIHGSISIQVGVTGFVKGADAVADAGNYGAGGARCLFSPYLIAASG